MAVAGCGIEERKPKRGGQVERGMKNFSVWRYSAVQRAWNECVRWRDRKLAGQEPKEIPFEIGCIQKITLSPWLADSLFQTTADAIKALSGCKNLRVVPSTLIDNTRWKRAIEDLF